MKPKKKCVDYKKIMARKVEKEEMEISLISKKREAVYEVVKKNI